MTSPQRAWCHKVNRPYRSAAEPVSAPYPHWKVFVFPRQLQVDVLQRAALACRSDLSSRWQVLGLSSRANYPTQQHAIKASWAPPHPQKPEPEQQRKTTLMCADANASRRLQSALTCEADPEKCFPVNKHSAERPRCLWSSTEWERVQDLWSSQHCRHMFHIEHMSNNIWSFFGQRQTVWGSAS